MIGFSRAYANGKVMLITLLSSVWLLLPVASLAKDESTTPHWSFEFKVGKFESALENWDTYYDGNPSLLNVGWSYKIFRPLEIGLSLGRMTTNGIGNLPIQQSIGGDVDFTLVPVNISLLYRFVFHENQLLVPYIGGGWTRVYYRQETGGGNKFEGSHDGHHVKLGIQILLDSFDKRSARNLQQKVGIKNTYLFLEAQSIEAKRSGIDLGGNSIFLGLLMEY